LSALGVKKRDRCAVLLRTSCRHALPPAPCGGARDRAAATPNLANDGKAARADQEPRTRPSKRIPRAIIPPDLTGPEASVTKGREGRAGSRRSWSQEETLARRRTRCPERQARTCGDWAKGVEASATPGQGSGEPFQLAAPDERPCQQNSVTRDGAGPSEGRRMAPRHPSRSAFLRRCH